MNSNTKHKTVEYGKYGYLFIAPFFIIFLVFQLYPLVYTIWLSFVEYYSKGAGKMVGPTFCGLANYMDVLVGKNAAGVPMLFATRTIRYIGNTLIMWLGNFIPQIVVALILAAWFTDEHCKLKGQGAFKIIMYLPNIITASSISILFYSLFSFNGNLRQLMFFLPKSYDFMEHAWSTMFMISFMQFWMWYGNTMIVLIAGILGINPSLYEAAMVDGASSSQQFFSITLPLLKPIIQFTLVTSAIGGLQMYDIPALFNVDQSFNGLPNYASETITMYIRFMGFSSQNYGKAAASSMVLFIVTLIISLVFFAVTKDRPDKQKHAVVKK